MVLFLSIVCVVMTALSLACGYCFGRADGIKWTRDVYNGKWLLAVKVPLNYDQSKVHIVVQDNDNNNVEIKPKP